MSLLTVVQDVCAVVGVIAPTSVFANINANRTMFEMVACANEMAQQIAYDERDWTALTNLFVAEGDGVADAFPLPNQFHRLTLSANVRRSDYPKQPLRFENNYDAWVEKFLTGQFDSPGEWIISDRDTAAGKELFVRPVVPLGVQVTVPYIHNLCVRLASGGSGDRFMSDADTFRLPERLLKLAMIWKWKSQKGGQYAEDMSDYYNALTRVAGADKPAPILIDRLPISSHARVSSSWPAGWGPP